MAVASMWTRACTVYANCVMLEEQPIQNVVFCIAITAGVPTVGAMPGDFPGMRVGATTGTLVWVTTVVTTTPGTPVLTGTTAGAVVLCQLCHAGGTALPECCIFAFLAIQRSGLPSNLFVIDMCQDIIIDRK